MAACTICGQKAGLFSSVHEECIELRVSALASIRRAARDALVGEQSALLQLILDPEMRATMTKLNAMLETPPLPPPRISGFWDRCAQLMKRGHLSRSLCHDAVIDGWLDAAEVVLRNGVKFGVLSSVVDAVKAGDEEFGLSNREERLTEARQLLKLSRIRSQVLSREPIDKVPFDVIPAKGEGIFWTFGPSTNFRQVPISTHGGGFGGVSVRIAPGVSVRSGAYEGESQPTHRVEPVATGTVAMSNLQTWFKSDQGITRIPHESLISTEAFADAFSLTRSTGRPVIFSLPVSERFPGFLAPLLVGLATDLAAIVKNRTPPVRFST